LKELEIPIITNFYSWTTILMIIARKPNMACSRDSF